MDEGMAKRRIRNFLLDKRFQLKYTLAVVIVSSIISAGLGYFLYRAHRESSRVASLDDPDLNGALEEVLQQEDRKVLVYLVLFLGGLVLALTTVGIIATHKIAGPAYSMRRTLSEVADGKLPKVPQLRRGDELQAVSDELRRMVDNLREFAQQDLDVLNAAASALRDQSGSIDDIARKLEELARRKLERIGSDEV